MTIQENAAGPQLLMLVMVGASIMLGAWIVVRLVAGRPAGRLAAAFAGLLLLYTAALLGVSAASGATTLKPGDVKCFDEWCAAMVSAKRGPAPHTLEVQVRLENRGRGAQKSALARAFLEAGGQRFWPRNPEDLQALVPGAGMVLVRFLFDLPAQAASARFVVTEAVSGQLTPGVIVIGDESSPFHALAGWRLGEFGTQLAT